jgi:hypothetical protein
MIELRKTIFESGVCPQEWKKVRTAYSLKKD